jgi:hypothetical protein
MKETKANYKSIIHQSVIAFVVVFGLFDLIYTFTGVYAKYGLLYPAAHGFLNIILLLALSFIWSKDKWGNLLFIGVVCGQLILDLYIHRPFDYQLILLIPALYFLFNRRK